MDQNSKSKRYKEKSQVGKFRICRKGASKISFIKWQVTVKFFINPSRNFLLVKILAIKNLYRIQGQGKKFDSLDTTLLILLLFCSTFEIEKMKTLERISRL